jgi:ubiquinone/menaquinone biosynthesis C-methylase UbiE
MADDASPITTDDRDGAAASVRRCYDFWGRSGLYEVMMRFGFLGAGDELRRRAADALGLSPGATVLDLCTGSGRILPQLAAAVGPKGRVVGVDISPRMLDHARRRSASFAQVELIEADAAQLPFPDDSFDAILASYGCSAVPDLDSVLDETMRLLRPGGRFSIADGNSVNWPLPLVSKLVTAVFQPLSSWHPDRDFKDALEARGMAVEHNYHGHGAALTLTVATLPHSGA